ncbi:hypothetical protein JCM16138_16150 [Thermococcus atlanticus]
MNAVTLFIYALALILFAIGIKIGIEVSRKVDIYIKRICLWHYVMYKIEEYQLYKLMWQLLWNHRRTPAEAIKKSKSKKS